MTVAACLAASGCLAPSPDLPSPPAWTNPFLAPGPVLVQLDHVPGHGPSDLALAGLAEVMRQVGSTPTVRTSASIPATDGNHTEAEAFRLHADTYLGDPDTWRSKDGVPVLHVLYLEGSPHRAPGHAALGWASLHDPLIVLFPDLMHTFVSPVGNLRSDLLDRAAVERSVLVHEYGHQLGLVGCGLPEQEPHGHECHSTLASSVMYPSMHHDADLVDWVLDDDLQPVWRFDDADWADIRAFQEEPAAEPAGHAPSSGAGPRGVDFKSRFTK